MGDLREDDIKPGGTIGEHVVVAVAEYKEVGPLDLPPLFGRIDPEALDRLFEPETNESLEVRFEYAGCTVVIDGTRAITVAEHDD